MLQRIGQVIPQSGYQREKRPDRVERTGGNNGSGNKHHDSANFSGGSVYLHSVGWSLIEMKLLPNDRLTALFLSSDYYFRIVIETKMTPSRFLLEIENKINRAGRKYKVILPVKVSTHWAEQGEHRIAEDYGVFNLFAGKIIEFADAAPCQKVVVHYISDLFGNLETELESVIQNAAAIALTFLKKMDKINERSAGAVLPPVIWEDPLVEGLKAD